MSDTGLVITVKGTEETLRGLDRRQKALRTANLKSLRLASEVVLRRAAENVSGRVLHVDRGALRQRLSYRIFEDAGKSQVGSPTVYAPIHEFGGTVQNPGGTAFVIDDRGRARGTGRLIFISNSKAAGFDLPRTRPHAINIPARPWLRPALADSQKDIEAIFRKGAQEALGQAPEASK